VSEHGPYIILPGGYQAESGLYLPSELPPLPATSDLPPGLLREPAMLVAARPPSFMDQVWVFATQEELGLDPTPLDVVIQVANEIPLWPAMKLLARFQRDLWPVRTQQEGQLELATRFFGADGGFAQRATAFLSGGSQRTLFSEQQLFALQKLLLMYGKDSDPDQELTSEEYTALMIALAAIPGSLLGPQAEEIANVERRGISDETWMRLFVGHGGFIGRGSIKHELARVHLLYIVGANSEAAKAHADYCPIDQWVSDEFGLSFLELEAAGFSLWAGSGMGDVEATPVLVTPSYFEPTALTDRAEQALAALSVPREWYRNVFMQSESDMRRLGFEITPFLQRPALRFDDGRVMPLAPRALEGWLGATGAYYRLFDLARELGTSTRKRFTRFNGYLLEQHVLGLAEAAHPASSSSLWVPHAMGEQIQATSRGESRTPDVALDYGRDLILVEVTSGRPTTKSIVDADPDAIRKDLEKLLEDKIKQLGERIGDLQDGRLSLPDVRIGEVERIWPVIVNSEGLLQTPALWDHLREAGALAALDRPMVQPLTLLDAEDYERLMGLAAEGGVLVDVLRSKTQDGWREREFSSWFGFEGRGFGSGESALIGEAFESLSRELFAQLLGDLTPEEYEARRQALLEGRAE
jgi:hypothetical protein